MSGMATGSAFYIQTRGVGSSPWWIRDPNSSNVNIFLFKCVGGNSANPQQFNTLCTYQVIFYASGSSNPWNTTSVSSKYMTN